MVYLLKMGIFHGKPLNNQMVSPMFFGSKNQPTVSCSHPSWIHPQDQESPGNAASFGEVPDENDSLTLTIQ